MHKITKFKATFKNANANIIMQALINSNRYISTQWVAVDYDNATKTTVIHFDVDVPQNEYDLHDVLESVRGHADTIANNWGRVVEFVLDYQL